MFFERYSGSKGLHEFEGAVMQKVVVKFWKQGWQCTVAAERMMELVRQECGEVQIAIIAWRRSTLDALQNAYWLLDKLQFCLLRMRFQLWKA